jgi:uncharacterized membrane protein
MARDTKADTKADALRQQLTDDVYYNVELLRPVKVLGTMMRPDQAHVMTGAILKTLQAEAENDGAFGQISEVRA